MTLATFFFWLTMAYVNGLTPAGHLCASVSQSTHSQVDTQTAWVYVGNCAQAFIMSLYSHGVNAWEVVS